MVEFQFQSFWSENMQGIISIFWYCKESKALNAILDELDLIYIYRTPPHRKKKYTFYSNAHGTFSRIDHALGHKTGLSQYQKTEIIPCVFSGHNALKLELNHKENFGRNANTWK